MRIYLKNIPAKFHPDSGWNLDSRFDLKRRSHKLSGKSLFTVVAYLVDSIQKQAERRTNNILIVTEEEEEQQEKQQSDCSDMGVMIQ